MTLLKATQNAAPSMRDWRNGALYDNLDMLQAAAQNGCLDAQARLKMLATLETRRKPEQK